MSIDGKKILDKLAPAKKADRSKQSLFLSKSLYKEFKDACGDIPASQVMEELMREFLSSLGSKTSKIKK